MAQNRQLAAIMFTDIAGYTALMGEDEQQAFNLLNQNRQLQKPLIEQYCGKWIKELGDGVLASFSSVIDAVNCARAIIKACENFEGLKLRIGIHLGDIVFENDDVFGDGVNIASRIQTIAPIGGIWVTESVFNNIANQKEIRAKFIKAENLKHVKEPVRIYEVLTDVPTELTHTKDKESIKKPVEKSLAVLPFVDMSSTNDQEYLGDGIAEELLTLMSQVKELKVIGRTSSFSFKGTKTDIKTIGKILNANTILEGSIQKAGNRVRITSQLINAEDGYHLWSQRYDREMDDIFALQDDICSKIAEHLKLTLLKDYQTREDKKPTNNLQAYELYLKGDFYFRKYTPEAFEKAIDCFKKAVELDPNYADAWWFLGGVIYEKHGWLYHQKEDIETVISCVNKALSIDATHANAHAHLAVIHFTYDYDWDAVEAESALAKKYAHTLYPIFLSLEAWIRAMLYGDFDFAIRHLQKGRDSDPLNTSYQFHTAQIYLYGVRNYEKTRSILNNIIELGFPAFATWRLFCLSYLFEGQYELAEEYARKDYEASEGKGHGAANLIISLAAFGKKEEAMQLYQSVKDSLSIPQFPEFLHVKVNAWLGRMDDAFDYLDKAITVKSFWLFTLKYSPEWDLLRPDPRFEKALAQMKFQKQ